ncbi:MAG: peptide ABC transporter substrate-binding protein [Clostridiaceae bacterium]|nr:peptide ABC transporter substrate-binding protein [Clostridiaceae bacterium]
MKKTLCLLLAAIFIIGMAAGCSGNTGTTGGDTSDGGTTANSTASGSDTGNSNAKLKIISYANGGEPPVLEPVMSNYAKTSILVYNLFCGLCRIGADGKAELAYAESYTVSDDGLVWTFKLRPNAKFSDGSELTMFDFEKAFKYVLDPATGAPGNSLKYYVKNAQNYNEGKCTADDVGYQALDANTLQVTLENPTPYLLDLACTYIPLKVDEIKANSNWHKDPSTYIGNGAFRVKELNPQVSVVMEKNPYYFDADNVKIDQVNFMFIDDPAVELQAYKDGTVNVLDDLNAEAIATYKNTSEYTSVSKIGCKYLTFNCAHVTDARVRKAMALALDRKTIIDNILGLTYKPATGLVPYGIHWGDGQYRDKAGDLLTEDVATAQQLMADAGYPNGQGFPKLKFITQNNQEDIDTAQAIQAMWKTNLGIECEIVTYESAVYWDVFDTEDWDVGRDGWTGDFDDPNTNLFLWEAYREVNTDGTLKDARWYNVPNSIAYDEIMQQTYTELDSEKRMNLFVEAEKTILDDMPVIPLFFYDDSILCKPDVTGVLKSYIGHVFFQYADVKVD